jgi:hypothetical protein
MEARIKKDTGDRTGGICRSFVAEVAGATISFIRAYPQV